MSLIRSNIKGIKPTRVAEQVQQSIATAYKVTKENVEMLLDGTHGFVASITVDHFCVIVHGKTDLYGRLIAEEVKFNEVNL